MTSENARSATWQAWARVGCMAAAIVGWGFFLYTAIGDRGAPGWDFSAADELPGSSPYAVHGATESPTLGTPPVTGARVVAPQHVGGGGKP